MTEAHIPPPAGRNDDPPRPTPEAEQRMRDVRSTLPPPPSAEELARRQGETSPRPKHEDVVALAQTEAT